MSMSLEENEYGGHLISDHRSPLTRTTLEVLMVRCGKERSKKKAEDMKRDCDENSSSVNC